MENPDITANKNPESTRSPAEPGSTRRIIILVSIVGILVIAALIVAIYFLFQAPLETTAHIRDIFIIFMALESLLLGLVLITLIIQVARLTNLLQNEIKPILDSTNETVSTLRGTTAFLSDNLVEPVIKLNEYVAALQQIVQIFRLGRKKN